MCPPLGDTYLRAEYIQKRSVSDKKLLAFSFVCVLPLGLCACGKKNEQKASLANPWMDAETLEGAAEAVGFEISVSRQISNY